MPLSPQDRFGPYTLTAPLGEGGMGEVWKARDTRLDRAVALKVSKAAFSERFDREARAVAALNHPHICQLYDVGPNYLVMEYIDGKPIAGPLPTEKAVEYAGQILEALDAAHRKGITHRDLKPANILVTKQGIKLLDFGLAKQAGPIEEDDATLTQALTQRGQIVGTLQYMAPEQLQGKDTDARSDLFAFGCVLYEMLTGKRAFAGESAASVVAAILEREPAPLTTAPLLDRLMRRALAKDPDQRFQTARDLKAALTWAMEQPAPLANRPVRRRLWIAAATLAAGALAGWSVSLFRKTPPEGPALRLDIAPPPGGRFVLDAYRGGFAVSPDGRAVAFIASVNGKTALWLRNLDEPNARMLAGTDNAANPFWSPDGKSIAYGVGNRLWRVDLAGGAPFAISSAGGSMRGGTFTGDGRVVFGSSLSGLSQAPASGGSSAALTTPDRSREFAHLWPQLFSRDRVLFFANGPELEGLGVYALSLAKSEERARVLATDANAVYTRYSGRGYLLWLRNETLVAQQFDEELLKPQGEARPLADSVGRYRTTGHSNVSVSENGRIVYAGPAAFNQLTWFDRSGKRLGIEGPPGEYGPLSISPDGQWVAAHRSGAAGLGLWLNDLKQQTARQVTSGRVSVISVWSPDGRTIVFRTGNNLARKEVNGASDERSLTQARYSQYPTDWSRDGRLILYTEVTSDSESKRDIWVLPVMPDGKPAAGSGPRSYLRTKANEWYALFSPEPGPRWVAYMSDETGRQEVYIAGFPEPHRKFQVSTDGGAFPSWGPGGRELFYYAPDGRMMVVSIKLGTDAVERSAPRKLFAMPVSDTDTKPYDVTSDGQRFLVRTLAEPEPGSPPQLLHVILNWPALLRGPQ